MDTPNRLVPGAPCVASIGASPMIGRHGAQTHHAPVAQDRCIYDDAKGLDVSPGSLSQDELAQGQIGYRTSQMLFLCVQSFQPLQLRAHCNAIQLAPPIKRMLCNANLPHHLHFRYLLPLQNFNLPRLRYDIFSFLSFFSHS